MPSQDVTAGPAPVGSTRQRTAKEVELAGGGGDRLVGRPRAWRVGRRDPPPLPLVDVVAVQVAKEGAPPAVVVLAAKEDELARVHRVGNERRVRARRRRRRVHLLRDLDKLFLLRAHNSATERSLAGSAGMDGRVCTRRQGPRADLLLEAGQDGLNVLLVFLLVVHGPLLALLGRLGRLAAAPAGAAAGRRCRLDRVPPQGRESRRWARSAARSVFGQARPGFAP